jgi:hypothetical protein
VSSVARELPVAAQTTGAAADFARRTQVDRVASTEIADSLVASSRTPLAQAFFADQIKGVTRIGRGPCDDGGVSAVRRS